MRISKRQIVAWLALSSFTVLAAGCGGTPSAKLYYVWNGAACPPSAPAGLGLSQTPGFTSRTVAVQVAATETSGISQYWRQKVKWTKQALATNPDPATRATETAQLTFDRSELHEFAHCTRRVVLGTPNPVPVATLPPLPPAP